MAYYVMSGYTTPYGVNSREKVKEYQEKLGVSVDGIWGPKTQAAYEKGASGYIWGAPSTGASAASGAYDLSTFEKYYNEILSHLSAPKIEYDAPDASELTASISAALYPSVEKAKAEREKLGKANKAEIDADAYARGMGASTYVSAMKDRENEDVADDMALYESDYAALLAEKLSAAMQYYAGIESDVKLKNASLQQSAQTSALSYAAQWYLNWLNAQEEAAASSASYASGSQTSAAKQSGSTKAGTGAASASSKKTAALSEKDCREYIESLSGAERSKLFTSTDAYWAARRQEIIESLGRGGYDALVARYGGTGIGGALWKMQKS